MSEKREQPQFGEYATPEEQRAAIRQPLPGQFDAPEAQATPADASSPPTAPPPTAPRVLPQGMPPGSTLPAAQRPRFADRIFTFVLLGVGLVDVIQSWLAAPAYAQAISETLATLNVTVSPQAVPGAAGFVVAIIGSVLWLIVAGLSWLSVHVNRISFWIPLAGGALMSVATAIYLIIVLTSSTGLQNLVPGGVTGTGV